MIDLEEESEDVNEKTLHKFGKYGVFGSYMYPLNMYIVVIVHKNPKNFKTFFEKEPSIFIKIHYIYYADKELWEKYENVINKIKQKKQLTDTEALDMAFIAKFISKEYSYHVVKTLSANFQNAIIPDRKLKIDVGVILGAMILKHVENENEQDKLMEKINMKQIEKEIHKIVYDEYGDVLNEKDKEIANKDKEIAKLNNEKKEYKKSLQKLKEMEDLNPEAKKIISSLILL